jgi:hypothetical protein
MIALGSATVGVFALAAASGFGDVAETGLRPSYATVTVKMQAPAPLARRSAAKAAAKPKVVYLNGEGTVNTDPAAPGGTGPYIDFRLTAPRRLCPRVINGGVDPGSLDLFQQGSYVENGDYHVLMGLDDGAKDTPTTFPYRSQLICLKGVR